MDKNRKTVLSPKSEDAEKSKLYSTIEQLTAACESYRNELQKQDETNSKEIVKLTREIDNLQLEICRQQDKLDHWKSICKKQQNENVLVAKSKILIRENHSIKQDMEVMKTVIRRLNKELSFYQDKLRKIKKDMNVLGGSIVSDSSDELNPYTSSEDVGDDETTNDLKNVKITLLPLLIAYDEVIADKNETIKQHEHLMEEFKSKFREIIQENESLRMAISNCKEKGSVSSEDWKSLYDNSILVLEENDLLHDKIEIMAKKMQSLEKVHEEKVDKLKRKMSVLDEEKNKLKDGLSEMDKQSALLTEQISKMGVVIQQRIPREEHESRVMECQQLFNDLKQKYTQERTLLMDKLNEKTSEKEKLLNQVETLTNEVTKLKESIKSLEKSNVEYAGSLVVLKKELTISVKALQVNEVNLKEVMSVADALTRDKEALEKSLNEQKQSTANIMSVRAQEITLIKECEEKMKNLELEYDRKLSQHANHAKKLEDLLETIAERHQQDLQHLNELVKEKNLQIQQLNDEKFQLEKDLETVWKVSAAEKGDNHSIKRRTSPS